MILEFYYKIAFKAVLLQWLSVEQVHRENTDAPPPPRIEAD